MNYKVSGYGGDKDTNCERRKINLTGKNVHDKKQ